MHAWFAQLLETYGYWAVALVVMGESLGLPVPGETLLLLGAASAGAGAAPPAASSCPRRGIFRPLRRQDGLRGALHRYPAYL